MQYFADSSSQMTERRTCPTPVSRTLFVASAIAGTLIGVAACSSGPKMVSKDDIAKQITSKMTDAAGNKPDSVSCPDGLKGQVGAQLNCAMKIKGQDYNVNVTATSVKGDDVQFDMVETVDKDLVASKVSEQLTEKVGRKPDSVTCPDNLKGTAGVDAAVRPQRRRPNLRSDGHCQ